jgi:hypothetical protein
MKTQILVVVFAIFAVTLAFAGNTILESFKASSDGKVIKLEWKSMDESGIARYELERAGSDMIFLQVKQLSAKGFSNYYSYNDEEAFLKGGNSNTQSKHIFFYRIKIIKNDDSFVYSDNVSVTHNLSGIRRTWGMIKEMFR